jgi:predicted branched-subunit amino acid permease
MVEISPKAAFAKGFRATLPFLIVVTPFSMLFGVVAQEAGLQLAQTMGFTILVIAGAAQFAALQMMVDGATLPLVLLAALAVNLRMAMYSAALVPHLGKAPLRVRALAAYLLFDQTYAISVAAYEKDPTWQLPQKIGFYFGVAVPLASVWCSMTLVGALIGSAVPPEFALDFALPITFLALIAPMLRSLAHVVAALISVVVALALSSLPTGVGLIIAAIAAMVAGALVETWAERHSK